MIVTDGSMWGPSLVLHEADGIPVVFASTLIFPLVPGRDAPLPGAGLGPPRNAAGRAVAWGIGRVVDLVARGTRRRLDAIRADHGLGPLDRPVNAWMARLPLYLVGSVPELDFGRRDLPPSVRMVGPLLWHPPEPPGTLAWLDRVPAGRPWVHVTEGTSHFQEPLLLPAAARGLAGAPYEAILTTGRERDPAALGLPAAAQRAPHGLAQPRGAAPPLRRDRDHGRGADDRERPGRGRAARRRAHAVGQAGERPPRRRRGRRRPAGAPRRARPRACAPPSTGSSATRRTAATPRGSPRRWPRRRVRRARRS